MIWINRPGIYVPFCKVQMGNKFLLKNPDETSENFPLASLATDKTTSILIINIHKTFQDKANISLYCTISRSV